MDVGASAPQQTAEILALSPNTATMITAAAALQALAVEAEELLGNSALDTLREMGCSGKDLRGSSAPLLRASSPVEQFSTALQRESQVLEALARAVVVPTLRHVSPTKQPDTVQSREQADDQEDV